MAASAGQPDRKAQCEVTIENDLVLGIKKEKIDVLVKPEPHECVVCVVRSDQTFDIYATSTSASGTALHRFLSKFTSHDLGEAPQPPKYICKGCFDLINVLEQAELEYIKLKETFESIISKNPLFDSTALQPIRLDSVKNELAPSAHDNFDDFDMDSEDEPLALAKKKRRKTVKKRKKPVTVKRKAKVKPVKDER